MSAAPALRLYEAVDAIAIVDEWIREHEDIIAENVGVLPPELEALLDQAEGDFNAKAERVALYIRELLTSAEAVGQEATRLSLRKKRLEKAAETLKDGYLKQNLIRAGIAIVKGALVTVRLQNNSQPAVKCTRPLEEVWQHDIGHFIERKDSYHLDTRRVLDAFAAGRPIPDGITVERGSHVRIV